MTSASLDKIYPSFLPFFSPKLTFSFPFCLFSAMFSLLFSTVYLQTVIPFLTPDIHIFHGTLSYFSFQPVLHDWYNKGRGMCYPVCGMVHIKEPLLLIGKSSPCGGSGFPLSLSEWSLTICLTPNNRR